MNRKYTLTVFHEKVSRSARAGDCDYDDLIVGFPSETEDDFRDARLRESGVFANAFTFILTRGTPAARWEQVPRRSRSTFGRSTRRTRDARITIVRSARRYARAHRGLEDAES
jgi:tRNA A37 methylthiotransferase MiaB